MFIRYSKKRVPFIDLTDQMVRRLTDSAVETRQYLPDGWEELYLPQVRSSPRRPIESKAKSLAEIGRSTAFLIAEDILSNSATNSWRNDSLDPQNKPDETDSLARIDDDSGRIVTEADFLDEKNKSPITEITQHVDPSNNENKASQSEQNPGSDPPVKKSEEEQPETDKAMPESDSEKALDNISAPPHPPPLVQNDPPGSDGNKPETDEKTVSQPEPDPPRD